MSKIRIAQVLCGCVFALAITTVTQSNAQGSEIVPVVSQGGTSSAGWFSLFRGRTSKSYYKSSSKKGPPSMSNGSFYEKWRADRKASGRAHRP